MPYVTDTHSLIWYMTDAKEISKAAKEIFAKTDRFQEEVIIPCIVFYEILYLVEKNKIAVDFDGFVRDVAQSKNYRVEPLCLPIIEETRKVARERVADPWDRLIVATARHLGFPLITRDRSLRNIGLLKTVW